MFTLVIVRALLVEHQHISENILSTMKQVTISTNFTDHTDDSVAAYFSSISKQNPITPEEETTLASQIRQGDRKALERLVCANLRFVVSVAKQFQNRGLDLCDLISEGNIGLIKAAEKFDETRGVKFISYAVWFVKQQILEAITEHSRMIRLPHGQVETLVKIKDLQNQIEKEECRAASVEEIAEALELPESRVQDLLAAMSRGISLDSPIKEDSDDPVHDIFAAPDEVFADSQLDAESKEQEIDRLLHSTLMERDIFIIRHTFGLGCEELTQEQIAMELGLSRERVRQLREQAILKMRQNLMFSRMRLCS